MKNENYLLTGIELADFKNNLNHARFKLASNILWNRSKYRFELKQSRINRRIKVIHNLYVSFYLFFPTMVLCLYFSNRLENVIYRTNRENHPIARIGYFLVHNKKYFYTSLWFKSRTAYGNE